MWTPCIWQGVQGNRRQKTHVYVDPLYLAGCIGYTGERKLMFMSMWTPCIWQGAGYTGERKLMFMWTPCIWQGVGYTGERKHSCLCGPPVSGRVQGIQVKENSWLCQCGPPVPGRVYRVYRRQKTHVYVDSLYLAGCRVYR